MGLLAALTATVPDARAATRGRDAARASRGAAEMPKDPADHPASSMSATKRRRPALHCPRST